MLAGVDYFDQGKAANTKIISKKKTLFVKFVC